MKNTQLQGSLIWLLLRVSLHAKKRLMKLAEGYNLSATQALTICLLEPGKAIPMHLISIMLMCDASNVTGIVDKLVRNCYIERKESNIDRRVNTITLTNKGAQVRTKLIERMTNMSSMVALSKEETILLENLLVKMLRD